VIINQLLKRRRQVFPNPDILAVVGVPKNLHIHSLQNPIYIQANFLVTNNQTLTKEEST
jgi:hypothetical protein